jgi:hypothetical protein
MLIPHCNTDVLYKVVRENSQATGEQCCQLPKISSVYLKRPHKNLSGREKNCERDLSDLLENGLLFIGINRSPDTDAFYLRFYIFFTALHKN